MEGCLVPLQGEGERWGPDASTAAVLPKPRDVEKRAGGPGPLRRHSAARSSAARNGTTRESEVSTRESTGDSGSWGATSHCSPPSRHLSSELWFPGRGGGVLVGEEGSEWHRAEAPFPREQAHLLPPDDVQRSTRSVHSGNVFDWLLSSNK